MRGTARRARSAFGQPWALNLPAALGFLCATLWMTWPLAPRAGSTLQDLGDPLFEIWVMRWVQHALVADPLNLYHANAFYPFHYSLAYSEEAVSTALLAWPVYLLTSNDVLAYNVMFLLSFWLMGFAVYLLARELGAASGAAFVAGLASAFAPARYGHVSHLHMLTFGWLPLTLWALVRFWRTGRPGYAVAAGICLTVQLFASLHLAVYTTLTLALFIGFFLWREPGNGTGRGMTSPLREPAGPHTSQAVLLANTLEHHRRRWIAPQRFVTLMVVIVIPYLLFLPSIIPHLRAGERYGFERPRSEVSEYAAQLGDFWSVFVSNELLARWLPTTSEPFFPGFVVLAGLALVLIGRRWSRPVAFAAALTLVGAVLALGLQIEVGGLRVPLPYRAAYEFLPPLRDMRGVGRFGVLTAIGAPLLAAFGLTALWVRWRERLNYTTSVGTTLTLLLSLAVCVELRSGVDTQRVPNSETEMAVYDWLAEQPPGPLAEFPADDIFHDIFEPIGYMYGSTRHWQPILAGYSGYLPPGHVELLRHFERDGTQPSMVTSANIGLLQDIGIKYVVIHPRPGYDVRAVVAAAAQLPELTRLADVGGSVVYRLDGAMRQPVQLTAAQGESEAVAGGLVSIQLELRNPNSTPAVVNLDGVVRVDVRRTRVADGAEERQTVHLTTPFIISPGVVTMSLRLPAPGEPGAYQYALRVHGTDTPILQHLVQVVEQPVDPTRPQVAIELVAEDWANHCRPGERLMVLVWTALTPPAGDYAATIQLVAGDDRIVRQVDAVLESAAGTTSFWSTGERQRTELCVPLAGVPPGDYELIVAMYSTQGELARIPLLLPDGSVGLEYRQDATPVDGQ